MVTTLDLARARVQLRRVGREYHGPCPSCGHGSGSTPETSDRISIKESGQWFCRTCRPQGGSIITWLREFEGKSCPEAHAAVGQTCTSTTCPAREKCPAVDRLPTARHRVGANQHSPAPIAPAPFVPQVATDPATLWQEQAAKLIAKAHAALLDSADQLAYLSRRGLPLEAVVKYSLGFIPEDRYGIRAEWGVEDEINPKTGRKKTVWIPRGLLIPTFVDGVPHRLRIRRPNEDLKQDDQKYVEVKGSGDDRVLLNPSARAAIVVESDLDALLIDWLAGDLISAIPMVSCSAKPKERAHAALQSMLCILVSLDYDARTNQLNGKYENPGGASSLWWLKEFSRAKRWPVPAGKDPGEYYADHGGDLRTWILQGLPPIFHLTPPVTTPPLHEGEGGANAPGEGEKVVPKTSAANYHGGCQRRRRPNGMMCLVADDPRDLAAYGAEFPDHAIFCIDEMKHLKGLTEDALDAIIAARLTFHGSEILETRPYNGPDPAAGQRHPAGANHPSPVVTEHAEQQELAI